MFSKLEEKYLRELGFKKLMNDFFLKKDNVEFKVSKTDNHFGLCMWFHHGKLLKDILPRESFFVYTFSTKIQDIPNYMILLKERMVRDLKYFIREIERY